MSKIAIITDTDSSLPLDLAQKHNITQVPIMIQFGDDSYRSVYDMDDAAVFARVDKEGRIPTTAAPSPGQFVEAFQAAFKDGADSLLVYTISSEMSATFGAARAAAETMPEKDISVFDTRTLALGQGFVVLAAAEAAAAGKSKEEIIAAAERTRDNTHLFAALSTLKYLAMGGRVSHLAAAFAGVLEVKPVLTVIDGKLQLLERVRTQSKSWARAIELAAEAATGKQVERIGYLHANAPEMVRQFARQVGTALACPAEPIFAEMTAGLSVHSGAGLVGVCFVTQ
ncbi:MAG: DegV family protein [Anaerolineales bacterium]|nr:DegV family protein [Anaerolineales bacterium]